MSKEMKELPVPADLVFLALNWAIALLEKPDSDCSYEIRTNNDIVDEALEIIKWVEKLYPLIVWKIEEGYDIDEWSVHLIKNGMEIDAIHSPGA